MTGECTIIEKETENLFLNSKINEISLKSLIDSSI
jgi:hypothetical protein